MIIIGLVILVALILETTVFNYLAIGGVKPDLLLIVVIYLALNKGALTGEISGFIAGFLQDVFSGGLIGLNALVKTIIGNLVSLGRGKLAFENVITQVVITLAVSLSGVILMIPVKMIFVGGAVSYWRMFTDGLIAVVYNAILAPFVFRLLDKLRLGYKHH
ncbi:MAG: rod shape-determining protein MreD [bacterium]